MRSAVETCKEEDPDDFDDFFECFLEEFPTFCKSSGFDFEILRGLFADEGLKIEDPDDWKNGLGDRLLYECAPEVSNESDLSSCLVASYGLIECYWRRMFQLCPQDLKNQPECDQLIGTIV